MAAKCTKCGHVFPFQMIDLGPNAVATLSGNKTSCPKCGALAKIGDGIFQGTTQGAELVSGPPETRAMLNQLYGIASKAKDEGLSTKEILAEVAEVNPELAKKLGKKSLPAFLLILLLFFLARHVSIDATIDINNLVDQAYHISQHEDPEKHMEEFLAKIPDAKSSAAETQPTRESRQVRRQRERQARKHASPATQ